MNLFKRKKQDIKNKHKSVAVFTSDLIGDLETKINQFIRDEEKNDAIIINVSHSQSILLDEEGNRKSSFSAFIMYEWAIK